MSAEPDTKICPLCAEAINSAAKVCPHCRHWQQKWSLANPTVLSSIWAVMIMLALVVFGAFVEQTFGPKQQFAQYRDQIAVSSFQISHRVSSSNLLVTVAGMLTNRSEIGWKNVGVEARFTDKSGKLFDAITVDADGYRGVAVLPHGEAAFKIEGRAARLEPDYGNCTVTVRWAKDVDEKW